MDAQGNIFIRYRRESGPKTGLGYFHVSGLVAGAPVAAAGKIKILNGKVLAMWGESLPYATKNLHLNQLVFRLRELGADLSETSIFYLR